MILKMKRHILPRALMLGIAAGALMLTSCSTTESRISDHPEIFNSLSPRDQALAREGKIRSGMSADAVWLAWGSPDRKIAGNMRGRETETWIYVTYETAYPYGYPFPYRPYYGFGFVGVRHHHHRSFVFFGDPFYDPFYYSYIPPSVQVPYKTVTFSNARAVSFQYLMPPYR
jgi:hypothetical protein